MINPRFPVSVLCAAVAACCCGQTPSTLDFDTSNMKVRVSMDRETYLPGEVAQITLTVTNLANTPVVSLKPFLASTSCLTNLRKIGSEFKASVGNALAVDGGGCGSATIERSNTTTLGPGESKQVLLNSYDKLFDFDPTALFTRSVPLHPATYAISFLFGASVSAQAEYAVVPAKLEADTIVRVPDVMFTDHPDTVLPRPLPVYVHVLAMRSDDRSYICVQQLTVSNTSLVARRELLNKGLEPEQASMVFAVPFKRVATNAASIVSLSATADADENLTIEWTDSEGGKDRLNYPASYPARPPTEKP
jgi:hypothetical protein